MKKCILMAFALAHSFSALAQDKAIKWLTFDEASELAAKEPKMILVKVYTDWCGWCKKMDKETFMDSEVINYVNRSEEHTSELQSRENLVCRLLLEKKKHTTKSNKHE